MCWVQLLTSTIQFLCISILETLLHVTMKRRAEISAVFQEFDNNTYYCILIEIRNEFFDLTG